MVYDGISGIDGDSDYGPVSCFDRGCRYRGISLETECVMDIGMDSILAEYHRELTEQ